MNKKDIFEKISKRICLQREKKDRLEDLEMNKNRARIIAQLEKSLAGGISNFSI